jgi:hypothetical protein
LGCGIDRGGRPVRGVEHAAGDALFSGAEILPVSKLITMVVMLDLRGGRRPADACAPPNNLFAQLKYRE